MASWDYDVFISYSRADSAWMKRLAAWLRAFGYRVRTDGETDAGAPVRRSIVEGIDSSRHVVLPVSSRSVASAWVQLEIDQAASRDPANRHGTLLPLLIEQGLEIPSDFAGINVLRFDSPALIRVDTSKLLDALGAPSEPPVGGARVDVFVDHDEAGTDSARALASKLAEEQFAVECACDHADVDAVVARALGRLVLLVSTPDDGSAYRARLPLDAAFACLFPGWVRQLVALQSGDALSIEGIRPDLLLDPAMALRYRVTDVREILGTVPRRSASDVFATALKLDRTRQWQPLLHECRAEPPKDCLFLLHGERDQFLDLFVQRVSRGLRQESGVEQDILRIPIALGHARPVTAADWVSRLGHVLDQRLGVVGGSTADKLARATGRRPLFLVVAFPSDLDVDEKRAFEEFVGDALWKLRGRANGGHSLRLLVVVSHEATSSGGEAWWRQLDGLWGGLRQSGRCAVTLPQVVMPDWDDVDVLLQLELGTRYHALTPEITHLSIWYESSMRAGTLSFAALASTVDTILQS